MDSLWHALFEKEEQTNSFMYKTNEPNTYSIERQGCWSKVRLNIPLKGWIKRSWNGKLLPMEKWKEMNS